VTALEQRSCRNEKSPSSLCSSSTVRLRRLPLPIRWYLRFGLSYRDVKELLTERGVEVDHVTIYRWVLRFMPLLADAADHAGTAWEIAGAWTRRM
jgi:hypothetical protein